MQACDGRRRLHDFVERGLGTTGGLLTVLWELLPYLLARSELHAKEVVTAYIEFYCARRCRSTTALFPLQEDGEAAP